MSFDQAGAILQGWNAKNNPPLPLRELAESLVNGKRYGKHPIGSKLGGPNAELLTQQDGVEGRVQGSDNVGAELLSAELAYADHLTFPLNALPRALWGFVSEAARSISCPPDFIALPLLTGLGAAIGKSRRIQIKRGWEESAALWTMIVGDSGTAKSPALEATLHGILAVSDSADWTWVSDTTVEALAQIMKDKPRGIILFRDELAAWIRGFDQYKHGRGSDEQFFLEAWSGTAAKITRKLDSKGRGDRFTIPQPFLSICGGIQPSVLTKLVAHDRVESGFAGRFLLAYPHRMLRRYTKDEVSGAASKQVGELYARLQKLTTTAAGKAEVLPFSADGDAAWCQWIESHECETARLKTSSPLLPAWSKMDGYAARLMLVVHLIRLESEETTSKEVDAKTVEMAGSLITYFKAHAIRVYSEALRGDRPAVLTVGNTRVSTKHSAPLSQPKALSVDEKAKRWIHRRDNPGIRPRNLIEAKIAENAKLAEAVCERLVKNGLAEWREQAGKRVPRLYLLSTQQSAGQEAA